MKRINTIGYTIAIIALLVFGALIMPKYGIANTTAALQAPTIVSPANGSVLTSSQLTKVDWDSLRVPDSTVSYRYQYESFSNTRYTDPLYSSDWLIDSEISATSTPEGTYYLRVRAKTDTGLMSDWSNGPSDPYKVTVDNTPPTDRVAPVLGNLRNEVTIPELSVYTFVATATDVNAGDTLTFSLSGDAPAGAAIDSRTGKFTWKPTERQGPGDYRFDVIVSDGRLTDSETITIHVSEVSTPDPTDKKEFCKYKGYKYGHLSFRNHGKCVKYFINHYWHRR